MDWKNRVAVFTQAEVAEMQKSFVEENKNIHRRLYNILDKYTKKEDVKTDILRLMEDVFENARIIEKDIKIEAHEYESDSF